MTDLAVPKNEEIDCPFCGKAKISVTTTEGYYSFNAARAFGKVKRIPVYHEEKVEVSSNCPVCGKTKKEIKEVLEKGQTKVLSHEKRIEMLKKRGLPLVIGAEKMPRK